MKILNLIMWVGQFGFSIIFPTLFFLLIAVWLKQKFLLGIWILIVFGVLGILTSISTTKSCLQALQKAAAEVSSAEDPPVSFNSHT